MGGLFCKNLSGQIIKIENDTARLFFQIPDSLMSTDFNYFLDAKGTLHILSNSFFKVSSTGKIQFIIKKGEAGSSFYPAFGLKDGTYVFQKPKSPYMYHYKNGKLRKSFFTNNPGYIFFRPFYLNNQLRFWNNSNSQIGYRTNGKFLISEPFRHISSVQNSLFADNESIWLINPKSGVHVFDSTFKNVFGNQNIFPDQFISSIYRDFEGNYLLGTFGSGIIVVPELRSVEFELPKNNIKINRITGNQKDKIFAGTQNGRIYILGKSNKPELLSQEDAGNVRYLKYLPEQESLLVNGKISPLKSFTLKDKLVYLHGAIKDIEHIEGSKYVAALNTGVQFFDLEKDRNPRPLANYDERTYCVNFNSKTGLIYAGTIRGLKIGTEKKGTYFTMEGKPIICNDIKVVNDQVFVSTQNYGVLLFEQGKLVRKLDRSNGLISNNTKQIKYHKGRVYLTTDKGFHVLKPSGSVLYTLTKSDGVSINKVIDFEIVGQTLWLVYQNGFHPIDLTSLKPFTFTPDIRISGIQVNESQVKSYDSNRNYYNYQTKKISFELSSRALKFRDDISYIYQLEGLEKSWNTNTFENNVITYKSLAPGQYTFKVKAICRDRESKTISYSFSIRKPIWKRWWFYLLMFALALLGIWLIYKNQLQKQLKETQLKNELMATKLTAIKSQMNPHFIFNSLNSIQDLVLQQDANNAYNYIGKFAKLVRQILHHSDLDLVEFEEELNILNLYIQLEQLRFKKDFEFKITSNNINDILIPPMLVQPFVENAIKHGLLHKKGSKKLNITFRIESESLHCVIEDNGIGRDKSRAINKRQNRKHKSFTVDSMQHRFAILKESFGQEAGAFFKDLYDKQGEPAGTQVTLKVPFKRKF